jgi:hypothetical protein
MFVSINANAQQARFVYSNTTTGISTGLLETGSGIQYHQLTWTGTGTVTTCAVKLQTSPDNITYSDLITVADCSSPGASAVSALTLANYVRINVGTKTGAGAINVTYLGFTSSNGGSGVITACITAGGVAYENGTDNTLTCSPLNKWADGTESTGSFTGPATSTLNANLQQYFFGTPPANTENAHLLVGSPAANFIGHGERYQVDSAASAPFGAWGNYVVLDATAANNVVVGTQSDVYYAVPMGVNNGNIQTSYETNMIAYGPGTSLGAAAYFGSVTNTGTGEVTTAAGFNAVNNLNTGGGVLHNSYGYWALDMGGVGSTLNAAYKADAQTAGANNYGYYSDVANKDHFGLLSAKTFSTDTNCTSAASPAVCSSAASGMVNVAAAASTVVVNTSAVHTNSNIMLSQDISANGGTRLGVTCNVTPVLMAVSAIVNGVSFTITTASVAAVNPDCIHYLIVN